MSVQIARIAATFFLKEAVRPWPNPKIFVSLKEHYQFSFQVFFIVMSHVLEFLGAIPIDPKLAQSCEDGENFLEKFSTSVTAQKVKEIVESIDRTLDKE